MRAGLDDVIQRPEVQFANKGSGEPHRMVRCHQLVEVDHLPAGGIAIGRGDTRISRVHRRRRDWLGDRQIRKQTVAAHRRLA
jgi:hypothetical protein